MTKREYDRAVTNTMCALLTEAQRWRTERAHADAAIWASAWAIGHVGVRYVRDIDVRKADAHGVMLAINVLVNNRLYV